MIPLAFYIHLYGCSVNPGFAAAAKAVANEVDCRVGNNNNLDKEDLLLNVMTIITIAQHLT